MKLQFDCPICEDRFEGSPSPDQKVTCPGCGHVFSSVGFESLKTAPPVFRNRQQPQPGSAQSPVAAQASGRVPDLNSATVDDDIADLGKVFVPKRKSKTVPILVMIGLLTCCAVLGAALYGAMTGNLQITKSPETDEVSDLTRFETGEIESPENEPTESEAEVEETGTSQTTTDATTAPKPDTNETDPDSDPSSEPVAEPPSAVEPMKPPVFSMIKPRDADAVWDQTQPYIVSLAIESGIRPRSTPVNLCITERDLPGPRS